MRKNVLHLCCTYHCLRESIQLTELDLGQHVKVYRDHEQGFKTINTETLEEKNHLFILVGEIEPKARSLFWDEVISCVNAKQLLSHHDKVELRMRFRGEPNALNL